MSTGLSKLPHKAGLFLHGYASPDAVRKEPLVIAPYSEGRFGISDKYYVLPKGSIDTDKDGVKEHAIDAALRETAEETGIDLRVFLGPENIAKLKRGESLYNITHPDFPGVTIEQFNAVPVDHIYKWHGVAQNRFECFDVQINGIEKLQSRLKNHANGNGIGRVAMPVWQRTADHATFPSFDDLKLWLFTGEMPQREWNKGLPKPPPLKPVDGLKFKDWFALVTNGQSLYHPQDWARFGDEMEERRPQENKHFREAIKQIKTILGPKTPECTEALGILAGDKGTIKLDEKDSPLTYYQEGADLLPAADYLAFCIERMRANAQYAQAFGGAHRKQNYLNPRDYLQHSQLIACMPFLTKDVIDQAVQRVEEGMDRAMPHWETRRAIQPLAIEPVLKQKPRPVTSWSEREQTRAAAAPSMAPVTLR